MNQANRADALRARESKGEEMVRTIRVGDHVGFRTFNAVVRYGEVVDVLARGAEGKPTRRDEISIRLKPDGHVVMVQRWRIAERYDHKKLAAAKRVAAAKTADRE